MSSDELSDIKKDIKSANYNDEFHIVLDRNEGGKISEAKEFLNLLRNTPASVVLDIPEVAASAAAFVWMYILMAKDEGHFSNVKLMLSNAKAILIYHRPREIVEGKAVFIESYSDPEDIERMRHEVECSDEFLVRFMQRYPNFIMIPAGENSPVKYTHEELFSNYYCNNIDINIPVGAFNKVNI